MIRSRPPAGPDGMTPPARLAASLLGIALTTVAMWFSLRTFGSHTLSVLIFVIPVVWAAVRFGVPGGIVEGMAVSVLSGPLLASAANPRSTQTVSQMVIRGVVFVAIGVLVAILVERARRAERQTRASQEHLDLMEQGVRDYAIYMLDTDGRVVSWNEGARRIKGYTEEDILNEHFSRFYLAEEQEQGLPQQMLERAARKGHIEGEGWRVRKDGSRYWSNVIGS